jgi:competence protein ComEC
VAALAAGILISRLVPFEAGELLGAIAVLALVSLAALWRVSRRAAGLACLCAFTFAGALLERAHRMPPAPELDVDGSEAVILEGCVVEAPVLSADRQRFVLELEPGARVRVSITPREDEHTPGLRYGQRIELDGRVRRARNFQNRGGFDYVRYLARREIYWTAVTRASAIRILDGRCGSAFTGAIAGLRAAALERIERLYGNRPYDTGMMQAILIGETSRLEKVWTEQFRTTGTFHVLVISGAHVAALAFFFIFLFRVCAAPAWLSLTFTTLAAWLYALVAGWQPPVIRAAAGLTLFSIARFLFRRVRLMNLLAAVALAFLLLDPEQLFEPSFQLSFLSVGFIAAIAVPLLERTSRPFAIALSGLAGREHDVLLEPRVAQIRVELRLLAETLALVTRLPERACLHIVGMPVRAAVFVYEALLVSAVVQLGLALPMAVYFHRVSFTGLSANVLVGLPMSGVVVAGFAAVLTGWWLPAWIAGSLLAFSQRVVDLHAGWEPAWRVPSPPLWLGLCIAGALVFAALVRRRAVALVIPLVALMLWHPFPPEAARGELSLTAVDVGQGEAMFLTLPDGKTMLLDGGGIPNFGRKIRPQIEIGEDVVSPVLWEQSIRRVDVAALSHAHEDHMGGLAALVRNFRPREIWTGIIPDIPAWRELEASGAAIRTLRQGDAFEYGGAHFTVIAPAREYEPREKPHNNDSLVLCVRHGRQTFLLSGDIERTVENDLLENDLIAGVSVLKVAHHGSKTSTSEDLLDRARPAFAIISAGADNSYGHPHPSVLARLAERRIGILRTDELGAITVRTDGARLRVDAAAWSPPSFGLYSAF